MIRACALKFLERFEKFEKAVFAAKKRSLKGRIIRGCPKKLYWDRADAPADMEGRKDMHEDWSKSFDRRIKTPFRSAAAEKEGRKALMAFPWR